MQWLVVRIIAALVLAGTPLVAGAQNDAGGIATHVVISEIQTGGAADAGQEFVELYNPTPADVAVDGWQLQYRSATGSTWSKKAALSGSIGAHGFMLLSSTGYLAGADGFFASGLSGTAGHVRVTDSNALVVDLVGWGQTAGVPETAPAAAPAAGQSIERVPGWLAEDGGNGVDSDNNSQDFLLRSQPEPQSRAGAAESPQPRPDTPADTTADEAAPEPVNYPELQITELLPDPASPQTDAADEFIELYNPNTDPVNVGGYVLKTGANFHASYILPQRVVEPGMYLAVYSAASGINLPNGGGAVELLDPAGTIIETTGSYGSSKAGQAYAANGTSWVWTLQPTPGEANVIVADDHTASSAATKLATPKPAKPKAAAKPKASKAAKSSTAKPKVTAAKSKKSSTTPITASLSAATGPSGRWLLGGLAGLTAAYILFEFRYDLRNLLYRARSYRRPGR